MEQTAIILRGPPAVGKSTIGVGLRKKIGNAVLFDIDYFTHMFGGSPRTKKDKYFAYGNCALLIKQFAKRNYNIIIEDLFIFQNQINYFTNIFKKLNYKIKIFSLIASPEILVERDKKRGYKYLGRKRVKFLHQRFKESNTLKENYIDTSKYSVKQITNKIFEMSIK